MTHPSLGLEDRAAIVSFVAPFLGQNGLKAVHLALEEGLHLGSLRFHLRDHLCLQPLNLCRVLFMVFMNNPLQGLLPGGKVLKLLLESQDSGFLLVCFHLVMGELVQQRLLDSFLHFLKLSGDRRGQVDRDSTD